MKSPARNPSLDRQAGLSLVEIMIALVVIGIGVGVFLKMQTNSGSNMSGNSKMMRAGQLVEKHIEAIRISVARDTVANWPPEDTTYAENGLKLVRRISEARSPKTGAVLPNARKVELILSWGTFRKDSLDVTTYVTRRF
jgi:prepilin-type N-terminal cleavage/methylation domain-containing protein